MATVVKNTPPIQLKDLLSSQEKKYQAAIKNGKTLEEVKKILQRIRELKDRLRMEEKQSN